MRQHAWRRLVFSLTLVGIAGAFVLNVGGSTAGRSVSRSVRPSARFLSAARTALAQYLSNPNPLIQFATPSTSGKTVTSYNWSGYADRSSTPGTFTQVSGTWTTPKVTCTPEDQISAEWVGIDGYSSDTVEQDGVVGWCFENTPTYFTWYEMYPKGLVEVGSSVSPGDHITASVSRTGANGATYHLAVTDATNPANSFNTSAHCAPATCLDTSVEWVEERPSGNIGIFPLSDYGRWAMHSGTVTSGSAVGTISSFKPVQINMVDGTGSYNLSTASPLTGGDSFSTTWNNSY